MAIGLTEEHEALAASVRGLAERHITSRQVREVVAAEEARRQAEPSEPAEGSADPVPTAARPQFWTALAEQGLPGLHLPEEYGGQGFGLIEQAVVLEELGRTLAPGPYVPTVLGSALIDAFGGAKLKAELLPGLADGSRTAAVALGDALTLTDGPSGAVLTGSTEPVLGAELADLLVLPVTGGRWAVVDAADVAVRPLEGLDLTRPVGAVTVTDVTVPADRIFAGDAGPLTAVVLGAEACGVGGRALDDAVAYAKLRVQFGRPIGQFQGVKHKCARMLIALEQGRAAVWDAARALADAPAQRDFAAAVAVVAAPDAAVACAEGNIQVHGGIGYTFEHDAHLCYRRALTLRALAGRPGRARGLLADATLSGLRRPMEIELPDDAERLRAGIAAQVDELAAMDIFTQRREMAEHGWVTPHLPEPWGKGAGPVEQIVIQQEYKRAKVRPVPLMIAGWVVPSLVQYGTAEQQQRFLPPTLRGEIIWCQLFSEPGAGSDLAGLTTKAEKVEGGWKITGQKIWNSLARESQWGICIARTDPDAPKHQGITYFLVDMAAAGIDVRPLRECTGEAVFNEVFLDGVFVPDDLVVGPVNQGWQVARNTLANERVGLTSSFQLGGSLKKLVELVGDLDLAADPLVRDGLGRVVAADHTLNLLGLRATLKQISGTDPGATANVRKLVSMEHGQRLTEYGFTLLGEQGAVTGGRKSELRRRWSFLLLASRAMSIGGGTTEVNLNVIGERILGLPRDPEPAK